MSIDDIDLSNLTPVDDAMTMEVRHPITDSVLTYQDRTEDGTEAEKAVAIDLYSQDSKEFKAAQRGALNRRLAKKKQKITAEEIEAQGLDALVAATKGWNRMVFKGKVVEFSKDNARFLYTALPWLREQVDEFIGERANFLTK